MQHFGKQARRFLAGTALAALATQAQAQQAVTPPPADTTAAANDGSGGGIGEIVVTAQKRSENAQNVPIAITALSTKEIAASGVTGTEDLRVAVPALNMTKGAGGFGLPRIRGVGATGQGNGIENPVAVYVDGVYYAAASGVLQSLFDVDQVAVLKGPQGTLFGRNATGGLIQITTLNPSLTEAKAKAQVGYGNYNTVSAAGFVSVPLSPTLAISASGQYEKRGEGFGKNLITGTAVQNPRTFAGRAKLRWEPTGSTSVLLAGDFNGTDDNNPAFLTFSTNTAGQNLPALIAAAGGDPRYDIYSDVDPKLRARQEGVSLTVEQDLGGLKLKSVSAYRHTALDTLFDPDGTATPTLRIFNANRDKTFTQEVDLLSSDRGRFKWVIGGFYMWNQAGQYPGRTTGLTTYGDNGYSDEFNQVGLHSWSGFGEGTFHLDSATNLTAGLRYTSDRRTLDATKVAYNGNINLTTTTVSSQQRRDFSKLSWKLSIDHRFSPELMAYASYNRGFRAGTFVPQANPVIVLEPEVLDAYEVGIKSDLFDRRVRFNLSGYYYDQSSVQVVQVIAGVQNVYSARGGAKIYGLDGDLTVQVTDHLRVFGGFNWTHARYGSFTDAIVSVPFPVGGSFSTTNYAYIDSATGQSLTNTTCLGTFLPANITTQGGRDAFYRSRLGGSCLLRGDATGKKLQNTPDYTLSGGATLDLPTAIGTFTLGGNVYYNDGFVAAPDGRLFQPGFTTANASLSWRSKDGHATARIWGNNITDAFYRTQLTASNSGDNGTSGAPRTYGITLGFEY